MNTRLRHILWPASWSDFVPEHGPFLANLVALGYFYVTLARFGPLALSDTKGYLNASLFVAVLSWLLCLPLCKRPSGERRTTGRLAYVALSAAALVFALLANLTAGLGPR